MIQDTLLRVSQHKRELKKPLKVQFLGEDGIDEGGVQKEFFQLIMAQIFDVAYGMFEYDADTRVFWFNRSSLESHREFQLIGVLIGVAIYNGVILDVRFPHVVYKKLMRQPLGVPDLQRAFPLVGRSLQQLLDFAPAEQVEETFALCMQVAYEEFGERKVFDLVEGGGEVPVTGANRAEYVRLYTQYLLVDSVATQSDAFLRGFESVCGGEAIQLFRWEELELLLCGSPNLDFEALERVTQYDDGFSCDSPCIALLWEVIHELPLEMKKKFLVFCTVGPGANQGAQAIGARQPLLRHLAQRLRRGATPVGAHLLQPPAAARVHAKAQGAAAQGGLGHGGLPHHLTAGPRPQSSSRGGGERAAVRVRGPTHKRAGSGESDPRERAVPTGKIVVC